MLVLTCVANERGSPCFRADLRFEQIGGDDNEIGAGDRAVFRRGASTRNSSRSRSGRPCNRKPPASRTAPAAARPAWSRRATARPRRRRPGGPQRAAGRWRRPWRHVGFRGQFAVDVHAWGAGQRHLEHAGTLPDKPHGFSSAETERGVEDAMPAAGELVRDLLRPLKTRVPQDHRQADHVVTPRAVVGENLGGRLRLRRSATPLPLETRFNSLRLPPAPCGKPDRGRFSAEPFSQLAGLRRRWSAGPLQSQ